MADDSKSKPESAVRPLYTPADLAAADFDRDVGYPGEFPFTRGVQPTMYRGRLWTMRQYAGFGDAEESNHRYRYLLAHGPDGPVGRLRPAHANRPRLRPSPRPGRGGARRRGHRFPRGHGAPLRRHPARQGLHLDDHQRHRRHPAGALPRGGPPPGRRPAQALRHGAERHPQGVHRARHLHLSARRRRCASSPTSSPSPAETCPSGTPSPSPATTSAKPARPRCRKSPSPWPTASPTCRRRSRPGSTSIALPRASPSSSTAHNNFLEEVAKFRAARRLWARLMRDRFHARNPRSLDAPLPHPDRRLHPHRAAAGEQHRARRPAGAGRGAGRHAVAAHQLPATRRSPCPPKNPPASPLRTQQIIAYETGVANTVDPLAGSYFIESLTNDIEAAAAAYLEKIDALGGMLRAIERGYVQQEIQNAAYDYQQRSRPPASRWWSA